MPWRCNQLSVEAFVSWVLSAVDLTCIINTYMKHTHTYICIHTQQRDKHVGSVEISGEMMETCSCKEEPEHFWLMVITLSFLKGTPRGLQSLSLSCFTHFSQNEAVIFAAAFHSSSPPLSFCFHCSLLFIILHILPSPPPFLFPALFPFLLPYIHTL